MGGLLHATAVCCKKQGPREVQGRGRGEKGLLGLYYIRASGLGLGLGRVKSQFGQGQSAFMHAGSAACGVACVALLPDFLASFKGENSAAGMLAALRARTAATQGNIDPRLAVDACSKLIRAQ